MAFGILKVLAKKLTLINKLQGSDINLAKISAPSFRNLPPKLLVPSALDGFKSFKTFIFFQETSQKVWSLNNLNFTLVTLEWVKIFGDRGSFDTNFSKKIKRKFFRDSRIRNLGTHFFVHLTTCLCTRSWR